VIHKNIQ